MLKPWPIYQSDAVVVSNLESGVAVLTLWTDAHRVAAGLAPRSFAACGNLYSAAGVGYLLRNLLANPRIRHLVLCGTDLTGTAEPVRRFFGAEAGGVVGEAESAVAEGGLTVDMVESVRRGVRLVDLVGVTEPERIATAIAELPSMPPWGEPIQASPPSGTVAARTSEGAGFLVRHASAARAWVQLVKLAVELGTPLQSSDGRALLLATAVLDSGAQQDEASSWFVGAAEASDSRLRVPQPRLLAEPLGGELALTAVYARLDLLRQWPAAARLARREHARLATDRSLHRGSLAVVANRLVLRDADLAAAESLLARRYPRTLPWRSDPRGSLLVRLEDGDILVEHGTSVGPSGKRWRGRSAEHLVRQILNEQVVSVPEHAAYLGRELHRAETAARLKLPYRQDAPLDLGPTRAEPDLPEEG